MAEEGADEESKTEDASPRRLQQAYDEGHVPLGRDVAMVTGLLFGIVAIFATAPWLKAELVSRFASALSRTNDAPVGDLFSLLWPVAAVGLGMCAAPALGAFLATIVQTKGGVWAERIAPDPERLTKGASALNPFKKETAFDLLLQLAKVLAIGGVAWAVLKPELNSLVSRLQTSPGAALDSVFAPLYRVGVRVAVVLGALAAIDLFKTRWQFHKQLRMSKDELKREMKQDEGDPLIKSRRRRRHRELLKGQAAKEVPRADALVVNPTHIAIAIRYNRDEDAAPRVMAKGKGVLAEHMRELAREHGIPIVQDIPLARLLYRKVKVGRQVPAETYKAVAAVLAFVYRVTNKSTSGGGRS